MTEFPPSLEGVDDTVVLTAAGRRIIFAAQAFPALSLLLSGSPMEIDEVARVTRVDAATLADVLIAEDICAEVTPELAYGYSGFVRTSAARQE